MKEVADDIDMMTSLNGNISALLAIGYVRGIHRSLVNFPHKGQWRGALIFSLICVWINGWVNNGEDGDSRRHRAHYDVIVMELATNGKNQTLHFRYNFGTTYVT